MYFFIKLKPKIHKKKPNSIEMDSQITNDRKKCVTCSKKVPLTSVACRCNNFYCSLHRSDVVHNCTYNYQAEFQKHLSTTLEKITSKKIEVI
jgi:hypothetical protein